MTPYINKPLTKGRLKQLVAWSLHVYGVERSVALVERLKNLGFSYATVAGLSLGVDDLTIPGTKTPILASSERRLQRDARAMTRGQLSPLQYFGRVITVWNGSNETLKDELLAAYRRSDTLNPVLMMAFSGARGNISQVRQLVGMRGLMADASGEVKDFAVQSNFREGLSLTEYLIACYGSRKGVVDTALKTATSGYLTRRLVDVAQHVVVADVDCRSTSGFGVTDLVGGGRVLLSLRSRLIGRVLCDDFTDSAGTIRRNREIDTDDAARLSCGSWVSLRSPLTCLMKRDVCRQCYGWNLAHGRLVGLGETVGVMAAQSIGEPGTQLTMRTFHTGGVFSGDLARAYRSPAWCRSGRVIFPEPAAGLLVRSPDGRVAYLTKSPSSLIVVDDDNGESSTLTLPSHSLMYVKQGQRVGAGMSLGESADASRGTVGVVRTVPSPYRGEIKAQVVEHGRAHVDAIWDDWSRSRRRQYDRLLREREEWATPALLRVWRRDRRRYRVDAAASIGSYFWVARGERQIFPVPGVCPYLPGDRFATGAPLDVVAGHARRTDDACPAPHDGRHVVTSMAVAYKPVRPTSMARSSHRTRRHGPSPTPRRHDAPRWQKASDRFRSHRVRPSGSGLRRDDDPSNAYATHLGLRDASRVVDRGVGHASSTGAYGAVVATRRERWWQRGEDSGTCTACGAGRRGSTDAPRRNRRRAPRCPGTMVGTDHGTSSVGAPGSTCGEHTPTAYATRHDRSIVASRPHGRNGRDPTAKADRARRPSPHRGRGSKLVRHNLLRTGSPMGPQVSASTKSRNQILSHTVPITPAHG